MQVERIWEFLRRLTPPTQNCLLTELERMEMCGIDMPGSADIQAKLRAELRKDGPAQATATPSSYFYAPLVPLLIDGDPEHENSGGSRAVRWPRSGNGSAATCCRSWRATTMRK